MTVKARTPIASSRNKVLGAGAIYFNYGEASEACIGATKGGSSFNVEREIIETEQDGTYGPIKGNRRKNRVVAVLSVNALELNTTNLPKFFAGMDVDTTNVNYDKVTERVNIELTDYLTNVAFVGETDDGEDVVIIVKNALGDGNIEAAIADKEDIVPEVQFTGHYAPEAQTTIPYEMRFPKSAADTTAPTVSCSIADGATDTAVTADIVWTFSEAIKADAVTAGNFILMKADGTAVAGVLSINAAQTIVTLNPSENLAAATAHIAIVTTNVTDIANNALAATSVINFTTA